MSGIAAIQARIAEIQQQFQLPSNGSFAAVLSAQASASSPTSTATASTAPTPGVFAPAGASPASGTSAATVTPTAVAGDWANKLPAEGRKWAGEIEKAANAVGLDPRLLASLVRAESGFDAGAGSHAGAIGLAQLMPGTAAELGVDPYNPIENLQGGARYLKKQLDRFGSPELALAAYNAGPGRVSSAGGIPQITETQNYVVRVMDYYRELQ